MLNRPKKCEIDGVSTPTRLLIFIIFIGLFMLLLALSLFAAPLYSQDARPNRMVESYEKGSTIPPAPTYELTVGTEGSGNGHIELNPPGGIYQSGTEVMVTAVAEPGSIFLGWSEPCSGSELACVVTLNEAKSVTATFGVDTSHPLARYRLTTASIGTGTGSIVLDPDDGSYPLGTVVTATAFANPGSTFVGWIGDCVGRESCIVTMEGVKTVEAIFQTEEEVPANHPTANDDDGSTEQGQPVVIDLIANDRPANIHNGDHEDAISGLIIDAISQPTSDGSALSGRVTLEGTHATFHPAPDFIGTARFSYLLNDQNSGSESNIDIGEVTITVVQKMTIIPVQNGERSTHSFEGSTSTEAGSGEAGSGEDRTSNYLLQTLVDIPAGALLNYPGSPQSLELSFGWLNHSTITYRQQKALPLSLVGHPLHFVIDATIDEVLLQEYAFGKPIKVAIEYPEDLFGGTDDTELAVRYWDTRAQDWQSDGVHIIQHDHATNVVVLEIGHLTQFSLFALPASTSSPGDGGGAPMLYLPLR